LNSQTSIADPSGVVNAQWVESGARAIAAFCETARIETIAVPALGCSNGGLPWARVRQVLEREFADRATSFRVYAPG